MKIFSDTDSGLVKRVEFAVKFRDGNREEQHTFIALADIDAFTLSKINRLAKNERTVVDAIFEMKNAIRSMLDDEDGTPADWSPTVLPAEARVPSNELVGWPSEEDGDAQAVAGHLEDDDDEERPAQFVGPDGVVYPMSDAGKFEEFSAGSSRRRWIELMDGDNNLTVSAKTISKVWRWLIGEAADRPTVR